MNDSFTTNIAGLAAAFTEWERRFREDPAFTLELHTEPMEQVGDILSLFFFDLLRELNTPCVAPLITFDTTELSEAFIKWEHEFREQPEVFYPEQVTHGEHTPEGYGENCAAYFAEIMKAQRAHYLATGSWNRP